MTAVLALVMLWLVLLDIKLALEGFLLRLVDFLRPGMFGPDGRWPESLVTDGQPCDRRKTRSPCLAGLVNVPHYVLQPSEHHCYDIDRE